MARFRIDFDADPDTSGPWQGRKSSLVKMIQSITDYLSGRCGANGVSILEIIDTPAVAAAPEPANKKRGMM